MTPRLRSLPRLRFRHTLLLVLALLLLLVVPSYAATITNDSYSFVVGDPTQTGRIFRNGQVGTCAGKTFPGMFTTSDAYRYKSYEVQNVGSVPLCVRAVLRFNSGSNFPFAVVYLNSFDPANPATNYLSDLGNSPSSTNSVQSFSFQIPPGEKAVVVVHEVNPTATPDTNYTLTIGFLSLSDATGSGQSASINSPFASPLGAKVTNPDGSPAAGLTVQFTAPASDASGTFVGGSTTYTATSDANGLVTTPVFTANGVVGSYTVSAVLTSGDGRNEAPLLFNLENTKGDQTITFPNLANRSYGDASFTSTPTASSGLPVALSSGTPTICTVSGSTVSIVAAGTCTLNADQAGDASYNPAPQVTRSFEVAKAPLTVTAEGKARPYGAANPALSYSATGFVLGEGPAVLTGALATTATAASPVGDYPITRGTLDAANYALSFTPGTLMVEKAPLTVTAEGKTRPYGAANPALTYSASGFVLGEGSSVLTGAPATTAAINSSVGSYPITRGTLDAANYTLSFTPGTLVVEKAPLTVTADSRVREYGLDNPALTVTADGFVLGEDAAVLTGAPATAATAASSVGDYPITRGTLDAANYALSFTPGTLTVEQAPLTVTADNKRIRLDEQLPAFTAIVTGFRLGETLASSGVSGSSSCTTTATASSGPGTYPITCTAGTLSATNYRFATFAPGTLMIRPLLFVELNRPAPAEIRLPVFSGEATPGHQVRIEVRYQGVATPVVYQVIANARGQWSVDTASTTPITGSLPSGGFPLGSRLQLTALLLAEDGTTGVGLFDTSTVTIGRSVFLPLLRS